MIAAKPKGASHQAKQRESYFIQLLDTVLPRGRGYVCLIHTYADESGTDVGSTVMSVGGYLFSKENAVAFDQEWSAYLNEIGIEYFRMSECVHRLGQFEGWEDSDCDVVARRMIATIKKYATRGIAVCASKEEFAAKAPIWWKPAMGGVYTACLNVFITFVALWAEETDYDGKIAYFFEAGNEFAGEANVRLNLIVNNPVEKVTTRYASHNFVDKGIGARPCEAADYLAWHANYLYGSPAMQDRFLDVTNHMTTDGIRLRKDFKALMKWEDGDHQFVRLTGEFLDILFSSKEPPPGFTNPQQD